MIKNLLICFGWLLPFLMMSQWGSTSFSENKKEVIHQIKVHHAGNDEGFKETIQLVEVQNKKGFPIQYYANVKSVLCLEQVCKVVQVRIFWNAIGQYQRYELDDGVTLEKYEDSFFNAEDYKKIHHIMANGNSPFKSVKLSEILTSVDEHGDADAVSGATALILNEEDTVPGAALTCFTLWHWANGEIVQNIRTITGASYAEKQFVESLTSQNQSIVDFAFEALINRQFFTKKTIATVHKVAINNSIFTKNAIAYFEASKANDYYPAIKKLLKKGSGEQKIMVLNSLLNTNLTAPINFYNSLNNEVLKFKTYQEIALFLNLMERKNIQSNELISQLIPLLKKDFLVARRVFYFLNNQMLNASQQKEIDAFYLKYENQL